jgi:hypothetical protein
MNPLLEKTYGENDSDNEPQDKSKIEKRKDVYIV